MSPKDRSKQAGPPGDAQPKNAPPARAILMGLGVLLAVVLGVLAFRGGDPSGPAVTGEAAIGGPFAMTDTDGRPVDQRLLQGKWSAVFFGYTYCPDVCPATLTTLAAAQTRLGDQGRDLQTVFVSVDPARDTPAQLKSYLASPAFPKPVVGLTGTPEQLAAIAKAYKVYYARNGDGPGYLMDHNSAIYLMDPQGRFVRLIRPDAAPDEMAKELGAALRRS